MVPRISIPITRMKSRLFCRDAGMNRYIANAKPINIKDIEGTLKEGTVKKNGEK